MIYDLIGKEILGIIKPTIYEITLINKLSYGFKLNKKEREDFRTFMLFKYPMIKVTNLIINK